MKKILCIVLCVLFCIPTAGCLEATSLEKYGYVDAVGFDKGEELDYKITFVLQMVDAESNAPKSAGFRLVSAECGSIFEAIDTITAQLPYELNFARTSMFLFSDTLAKEDGALERLMNAMISKLQIRYNASAFISLGNAHEVLAGLENEFDPNITQIISNFVSYSEQTGLAPIASIDKLFAAIQNKTDDILLPVCGLTEVDASKKAQDSVGVHEYAYIGGSLLVDSDMKTGLCGSAIMSGGRMVGLLDGQHTQLLLMIAGSFHEGRCVVPLDNGDTMEVHLELAHPPEKEILLGETPSAKVSLFVVAEVEMPEYFSEYSSEELESIIATFMESEMSALFHGVQRLDADPFGFGQRAVTHFSDTAEWEHFDWKKAYQAMDVSFEARIELVQSTQKSVLE